MQTMAAGSVIEDVEVGFEEAMSWLPSHVLDEAMCESKREKDDLNYVDPRLRSKLPAESFPIPPSNSKRHQKARNSAKWASGGPGMQAFFLNSTQKSCGTGVFLPQSYGSDFHSSSSTRPACSLVLLPSRVVQALNLNVHELGLQISPPRDSKNNNRRSSGDLNSLNNKNGKDLSTKRNYVISHKENSSPEIFLPKEWTY